MTILPFYSDYAAWLKAAYRYVYRNGAHSSAIPEADLRKKRLLAPQFIIKEGPAPLFQITVANGDLESPKSTVELMFQMRDIEFHERSIVMEKISSPIIE